VANDPRAEDRRTTAATTLATATTTVAPGRDAVARSSLRPRATTRSSAGARPRAVALPEWALGRRGVAVRRGVTVERLMSFDTGEGEKVPGEQGIGTATARWPAVRFPPGRRTGGPFVGLWLRIEGAISKRALRGPLAAWTSDSRALGPGAGACARTGNIIAR